MQVRSFRTHALTGCTISLYSLLNLYFSARDAETAAATLQAAQEAISEQITEVTMDKTMATNLNETMNPDTTVGTVISQASKQPVGILKKKPGKKKLTPKERKQRNVSTRFRCIVSGNLSLIEKIARP